jgi:hypothetical protein
MQVKPKTYTSQLLNLSNSSISKSCKVEANTSLRLGKQAMQDFRLRLLAPLGKLIRDN